MRSPGDVFYNFHWIVPGEAARSSQAYAGFLGWFLRRRGIRTMINLRGPNPEWRWWQYEKRVCGGIGVGHIDVALSSKNLPTRTMLLALLDAFDEAARPMLIKCSGGQDRTSFGAALYLLHTRGWSALPAAQAQFAIWPYLHWPRDNQRWLKLFPAYARETSGSRPLREWIGSDYDPVRLKAWLEASGFADSFRAVHD
jgi:hypothetical protein